MAQLRGRTAADRILAVVPPISAFVAAGFEHSVANMYFVPFGLLIARFDPGFAAGAGLTGMDLGWIVRRGNLAPVTLGNLIGGAGLVGAVYWFVYLRPGAAERGASRGTPPASAPGDRVARADDPRTG